MYQLDSTDFVCIRSRCNPNNIEAVCQNPFSSRFPLTHNEYIVAEGGLVETGNSLCFSFLFSRQALIAFFLAMADSQILCYHAGPLEFGDLS